MPSLEDCFATKGIEKGLSARPSCRFEVFKQKIVVRNNILQIGSGEMMTNEGDIRDKSDSKIEVIKCIKTSSKVDVDVEVVLDIAHNEDAMIALVTKLKGLYPNRIVR